MQIPSCNSEDNRILVNAHVENGRWQCDLSVCSGASTRFPGQQLSTVFRILIMPLFRRTGYMNVHRRVVPGSLTVLIGSSFDSCALVHRCCIVAYRPRRKKGRIKRDVEKRHSVIGEQKIVEDVLHFESGCDKMILSTPVVTNCLSHGRAPSLLQPAMVARLPSPSYGLMRWQTNQRREPGLGDPMVTNLDAGHVRTKGRIVSWIHRSPTHTKRESSNDKFHCQWHERVVFCFGLLTCIMITRLIIFPMTHISLRNETRLTKTPSFTYPPFRFFSFVPALNKQTQRHRDGLTHNTHDRSTPFSCWLTKASWLIRSRSRQNHHYCPEGCIGGSIPPESHRFSSKFPSNLGPFLLSQLTDLLSSPNR